MMMTAILTIALRHGTKALASLRRRERAARLSPGDLAEIDKARPRLGAVVHGGRRRPATCN